MSSEIMEFQFAGIDSEMTPMDDLVFEAVRPADREVVGKAACWFETDERGRLWVRVEASWADNGELFVIPLDKLLDTWVDMAAIGDRTRWCKEYSGEVVQDIEYMARYLETQAARLRRKLVSLHIAEDSQ